MMLDYFYGQSGELFAYFRIPKALFQDSRFRQLSTDARTLYGILLDRMSLSAKNSWVDLLALPDEFTAGKLVRPVHDLQQILFRVFVQVIESLLQTVLFDAFHCIHD